MARVPKQMDPVRVWLAAVVGGTLAIIIGVIAFPRQVYEGFIWRFFLGPVDADAHGVACTVRRDGDVTRLTSLAECHEALGIVAYPGYTTVSTTSYAIVLIVALIGVLFFLRHYDIGDESGFFFSLFPFMLFGGALRVVEDLNVVLIRDGSPLIPFPWSGLIISPFIYFTVFFIVLFALFISLWLANNGFVDRYETPLVGIGTLLLLLTLGLLGWFALTHDNVGFNGLVALIAFGGAIVVTAVIWHVSENHYPSINRGTGLMGALVIWGHTVDGIANVLSLDWAPVIGIPAYAPKHVINSAIIDITGRIQPIWLSETIGTAWPFLFVKIGVAVLVVWIFDEQIFEESPRFSILLLIAILAVGIGPGTRDTLRATLGI